MKYPEERLLIVRPCLKAICYRDKPASKLLSLLLYYARNCDEQETEFTFTSRQDDIITDLLDEMDVKTLHRTAIPMLRLLGYIDVDGSSYRYTYTVHIGYIQKMLNFYATNKQQLDKCLIDIMRKQLDIFPEQLDIFLKQIDKSRIQLDKCLIPFRQMSNSKRGRKPRPQATAEAHFEDPQITIDNKDITENIYVNADALTHTQSSENENNSHQPPADDIAQASGDIPIATTPAQDSASVGVATRNTDSLFSDVPPVPDTSQQNGKHGSLTPRTSKKAKVDAELQERIKNVYSTLDKWMQKITGDPETCYAPTKRGDEAIIEMLACKPTPLKLEQVCDNMWNEHNEKGEYWWRGRGRMSVPAICRQYPSRVLSIVGKSNQVSTPQTSEQQPLMRAAGSVRKFNGLADKPVTGGR